MITTEQLESLYNQAMQYCHAAFGSEPNELHIGWDGMLKSLWYMSCRGEYYEDEEYITPELLTKDLEEVRQERLKKEQEARMKAEEEAKKHQDEYEQRQKELRKMQYLKLKEEFEK